MLLVFGKMFAIWILRVFDGSQVMNIAFLADDEKQNAEINCPYI